MVVQLSRLAVIVVVGVWVAGPWIGGVRGEQPTSIDRPVADFSLPTTDDGVVSFSTDPAIRFHVLCFLGTECPLARLYGPRLQRLSADFAARGVQFIGINSNLQDSMEELKEYVRQHGIEFPVAKDFDRRVAISAGATRTPEVFVVDLAGQIRYQGRIDDQYQPGLSRSEAAQHDLRDALEQLLAGQPVARPKTTAVGCLIALPRETTANPQITFCDQVVRVLQEHCIECHRSGEIGPFPLDAYDQVVGWADMSLEVIEQGRMPPWHASPAHGSFANARHLSEQDKAVLRQWVESGMPYGQASQLPPPHQSVQGWRLAREPDAVYELSDKPFAVPAEGTVEYQYFVVDPGFTEDRWIHGAQVIPGNPAVVHHCIVFTRPPDGADFRDIGLLSAYVPGQINGNLPQGYAQRVRAGSRFVFQMHYTPNGKPQHDLTRLGIVFAEPDEVTHEVFALAGLEQEFEIPPAAASHEVQGSIGWFPKDGLLLSITPHMHLRGKSFQFRIESGAEVTTLLDVPAYDFNWQHSYELATPLPLEHVDRLTFSAVFDNSSGNPNNPDPAQSVTWGDQTWQEMAVTFLGVARPLDAAAREAVSESSEDRRAELERLQADWQRESAEFAARYIQRFDANGDQQLTAHELPDSVRLFHFWNFDHNGDGRLDRDEIQSESYWRLEQSNSPREAAPIR